MKNYTNYIIFKRTTILAVILAEVFLFLIAFLTLPFPAIEPSGNRIYVRGRLGISMEPVEFWPTLISSIFFIFLGVNAAVVLSGIITGKIYRKIENRLCINCDPQGCLDGLSEPIDRMAHKKARDYTILDTYICASTALIELGDGERAVEMLLRELSKKYVNSSATMDSKLRAELLLAEYYLAVNDMEKAEKYVDRADETLNKYTEGHKRYYIKNRPDMVRRLRILQHCLAWEYDEALELLNQRLDNCANKLDYVHTTCLMAAVYSRMGDKATAGRYLERVEELQGRLWSVAETVKALKPVNPQ